MLRAEEERDRKRETEKEREIEKEEPVLGNYNDRRRWKTLESTPTDFVPPDSSVLRYGDTSTRVAFSTRI